MSNKFLHESTGKAVGKATPKLPMCHELCRPSVGFTDHVQFLYRVFASAPDKQESRKNS